MKSNKITPLTANDWRAFERSDGSVYMECGAFPGEYHMAFDAYCDIETARRLCIAMNILNNGVHG